MVDMNRMEDLALHLVRFAHCFKRVVQLLLWNKGLTEIHRHPFKNDRITMLLDPFSKVRFE